jgi:hypothetical protein
MRRASLILMPALVAGTLASGCGGGGSGGGYNRPDAQSFTDDQIAAALGVSREADESGVTDSDGECDVDVYLHNADEIALYADAGDPVATNPSGTVGVKVGFFQGVDERMCFDRFQGKLKALR